MFNVHGKSPPIIKRHAYQRKKKTKKKQFYLKTMVGQTSWPKWDMVYKISSDVAPNLAQFQLFKSVGVLRNEENWEIVFNNRLLIVFIQLVQNTFNWIYWASFWPKTTMLNSHYRCEPCMKLFPADCYQFGLTLV